MNNQITPYQMCINNIALYIRHTKDGSIPSINAFDCSEVIAIAFCKFKEEVLADIIRANV